MIEVGQLQYNKGISTDHSGMNSGAVTMVQRMMSWDFWRCSTICTRAGMSLVPIFNTVRSDAFKETMAFLGTRKRRSVSSEGVSITKVLSQFQEIPPSSSIAAGVKSKWSAKNSNEVHNVSTRLIVIFDVNSFIMLDKKKTKGGVRYILK